MKFLKISGLAVLLGLMVSASASASFLFTVPILDRTQIAELADEALVDVYIEVMVEVDAVKTFYSKGGFTPKELQSYKDLLRCRIFLIMEFQKRKLEIPAVPSLFP